jgi:hypothetical protein
MSDSILRVLENEIIRAGTEQFGDTSDPTLMGEFYSKMFDAVKDDCIESSIKSYMNDAQKKLDLIRSDTKEFEGRTFLRWKPAFDHLEMLWEVARDLGNAHGKDVLDRDEEDNNIVMAALASIYPKSLLIVQEIICLLKGGFPDGALSRWRSLHELSISAMYIAKHGEDMAKAYLLSFHFSSRRAALQMNESSDKTGLTPFSKEEMLAFDERCRNAEILLGRAIEKDSQGEWPRISNKHTDFAAIEQDVGMAHWRPWYKWASGHTHAAHYPSDNLLGMVEAEDSWHLIGSSNSGFVDPFQLTALSLSKLVCIYLMNHPNPDRLIHIEVFQRLSDLTADIALEAERISLERHRGASTDISPTTLR